MRGFTLWKTKTSARSSAAKSISTTSAQTKAPFRTGCVPPWLFSATREIRQAVLRYARMSVNYENEQRTLINKVAEDEKKLACIEQTSLDLKTLLKVLRSSTSFEELTPTLVNSLIRRIEVHNNDKSSGHCYVKVDIYFTAIGLIDIPTEDEIKSLMAKIKANPQECRLTA